MIRQRISHTSGAAVLQTPLLDNQEGAQEGVATEPYVFGKPLATFSSADSFGTDTIPTVEINDHGKSAQEEGSIRRLSTRQSQQQPTPNTAG